MLTAAELCLLAEELDRLAAQARVRKIHQPSADRLVLRVERDGEDERNILIVANRRFARAHFAHELPLNPKTPPQFCEDARRLLQPARLVSIKSRQNDRILDFVFECRADDGSLVTRTLVCELFGNRPNLAILSEGGTIEALLDTAESADRLLKLGARYRPPQMPDREMAARPPFIELDGFAPRQSDDDPLSRALERWVGPREQTSIVDETRRRFEQDLRQQRKKLDRLAQNLESDIRASDAIPRLRFEGELLKANLHLLKRGMKSATLVDWTTGESVEVDVALNPMRTPAEEVSTRFDEAHRLERAREAAQVRREQTLDRVAKIDAVLSQFAAATTPHELDSAREAGERAGVLKPARPGVPADTPRKKPVQEPRKPYHTFVSKDGIEMLVGRTAADNDELTFAVANGNDFWFHVRDYPGSHVVIRAREELPPETLLDAATLAVHFSKADSHAKRDVSWTRRKFVTKARGAPPGQVLLSSHKTLHLRPDPARLARLLGRT